MKTIFKIILVAIIGFLVELSCPFHIIGQESSFKWVANNSVRVVEDGQSLNFPWAGGLNQAQFSSTDLNNDLLNDLIVFDRAGDVLSCFEGIVSDTADFRIRNDWANNFPDDLHDWLIARDINNDGLADLLTYGNAGVRLYWNRSSGSNIAFELKANEFKYQSSIGTPINILSNSQDIPAFYDVNNDGDLDVLQFDFSGTRIEYFENQSQELTNSPADSIYFLRLDQCWGKFLENDLSNELTLNADCRLNPTFNPNTAIPVHTGSTILAFDPDSNQLTDLIIGDVGSSNVVYLHNNGSPESAFIDRQDAFFPSSFDLNPVEIFEFCAPFQIQIGPTQTNNLVFAPNTNNSIGQNQIWRYQQTENNTENWTFEQNDFLINEMIDIGTQAHPCLIDIDGDLDLDLLIGGLGNYDPTEQRYFSQITAYENTGTNIDPVFNLIQSDFAGLAEYNFWGVFPTSADLDSDQDQDLIFGNIQGDVYWLKNDSEFGVPNFNSEPELLFTISDNYACPSVQDIDSDGAPDLIIGGLSGRLHLWQMVANEWQEVNDFWGEVDVREQGTFNGYACPLFASSETGDSLLLYVRGKNGSISAFDWQSDFDKLEAEFYQMEGLGGGAGGFSFYYKKLLVGNEAGGIEFYSYDLEDEENNISIQPIIFKSYPNPTTNSWYLEGPFNPEITYHLDLFDLQGKRILSREINVGDLSNPGLFKLELNILSSGMYLYRFFSDQTIEAISKGKIMKY